MNKIRSWLLLFIFVLAIFFCITMPFELRNAIKSQSWEPRDLRIQSSEIVKVKDPGPESGYDYRLKITAIDLSNNKLIRISDVKYGDFPFTIISFGKMLSSDYEAYVKKYPAGAEVTGYKNPNSNKYVLEKGDITLPVILLSVSALWLSGNVFIMIRYPKSRKSKEE